MCSESKDGWREELKALGVGRKKIKALDDAIDFEHRQIPKVMAVVRSALSAARRELEEVRGERDRFEKSTESFFVGHQLALERAESADRLLGEVDELIRLQRLYAPPTAPESVIDLGQRIHAHLASSPAQEGEGLVATRQWQGHTVKRCQARNLNARYERTGKQCGNAATSGDYCSRHASPASPAPEGEGE